MRQSKASPEPQQYRRHINQRVKLLCGFGYTRDQGANCSLLLNYMVIYH